MEGSARKSPTWRTVWPSGSRSSSMAAPGQLRSQRGPGEGAEHPLLGELTDTRATESHLELHTLVILTGWLPGGRP